MTSNNAFIEDGVFNNIAAGESYTGDRLGDVVTYMANLLPDVQPRTAPGRISMNIMLAQMGVYPDFASAVKAPATTS